MVRNASHTFHQKKRMQDVCTEKLSKVSDKEDSTGGSSSSSSSTSTTRRRPWKVSPASSPVAGSIGRGEGPSTEPSSKNNSKRHLLFIRQNPILPHRFFRDFRSCCFCCCLCCTCSCLTVKKPFVRQKGDSVETNPTLPDCKDSAMPTLEEIRSWGESFDRLMKCSAGRQLFREFLRCEYSEENILFWLACEELKAEVNPEVVEEKARVIYEDFVSILSPREVSLDSKVREIVNRNMARPTINTFDEAQLQIYTLMHRDSYPRFVGSPIYRRMAQLSPQSRKTSVG